MHLQIPNQKWIPHRHPYTFLYKSKNLISQKNLLNSKKYWMNCRVKEYNEFITAHKRSCGKVMFYTCLSVILFTRGCITACNEQWGVCLGGCLPRRAPRPTGRHPFRGEQWSWQYTSYWNVFFNSTSRVHFCEMPFHFLTHLQEWRWWCERCHSDRWFCAAVIRIRCTHSVQKVFFKLCNLIWLINLNMTTFRLEPKFISCYKL